jgi:hypothetical protein
MQKTDVPNVRKFEPVIQNLRGLKHHSLITGMAESFADIRAQVEKSRDGISKAATPSDIKTLY